VSISFEAKCRNGTLPFEMKRKGFCVHYLSKRTSEPGGPDPWGKVTDPTCPSGAFRNLTSGMRPFIESAGEERTGGKLATQVRVITSSPVVSSKKSAVGLEEVCAQSMEFVAVPDLAARMQATLPGAIRRALQRVEGFAGCAVMVSEQEARLVTVVTFWRGKDRGRLASANSLWVEQLLDPYVDRQLRTHTLRAQIALQPET
jgi:hypothetical protein